MKKIKLLSGILLVFAGLSSCYKDKGNYDYTELNELTINGLESRYERDQDDSLHIPVALQGTQYADTTQFTYEWEIGRKIVYTGKDLRMKVNLAVGEHLGRFIVTDKGNGIKAYFRFGLRVSSATAGDLLLVLSNYNGQAELSYKRLDKDGNFAVNYYRERFGEMLGSGPRSICISYNSMAKQIPFADDTTKGSLQVITAEGMRLLDKNTMGPKSYLRFITGGTFASFLPPYPVQDVSGFEPQYASYQLGMWNHNPYGGINQDGRLLLISGGALYFNAMSRDTRLAYVNQKPDNDGYLAPALCYAYVNNSQQTSPVLQQRGYDVSTYALLYDNKNGKFLYSNYGRRPLTILNKDNNEYLPSYPGYKMIYASHTSTPNKCVAILHNGTRAKIVYLTVPGNATEQTNMPFAINGETEVSSSVINEDSRFYTMTYSPYLLFSSGTRMYRYNILNVLNNAAPSEVIADLGAMGYSASDKINAFTVSRTERNLLMAVSRYGTATNGDGPLRGDVVKMTFNNSTISLLFDKKYESVSGNPVDIRIKYQTHQRDGIDKNGVPVDKI
ncbi:PKD-like family lipoprotein [Chitinophaga nivalis]|uniref:PKD-like family lipoprotein n=1 Tax=Chitinophaga nivalis TaxID=2991709 RepID=A0ABT3IJQ2_9BACT|nr:PKD-like family lipoprotein [Chitinophaga nivalis]MCW3466140.1 PKD-like family lipoprotein [Chitinophaga nivalis]MCW3484169.1 PKD-like family lipoprotein [Chitinophaga nivalis]